MARHIAIIGSGNVGATTAFTLLNANLVEVLSLIDIDEARAEGEALDLMDGLAFLRRVDIRAGGYDLCQGAQVVIVTAGAGQKPGQSRMDLLEHNAAILSRVIPAVVENNNNAVIVIVTNPVDPLTYLAGKLAGLPAGQVLGSGTVLDTARLRNQISLHCQIDPRNIHGYIIGEHGDCAVPVWSAAQIAGLSFEDFCRFCGKGCSGREEIGGLVRTAAERIITRKGATYYSIALAVKRIVESIIGNENSVLTVSSMVNGYYDIEDVCLSLPCIVGSSGVKDIMPLKLNDNEALAVQECARKLKEAQQRLAHLAEPVPG